MSFSPLRGVAALVAAALVLAALAATAVGLPGSAVAAPPSALDRVSRSGVAVSDDAAAYAEARTSPDWLRTPSSGLEHTSCVQQLPEGATFNDGVVVLRDGQRRVVTACRYPRLVGARHTAPRVEPTTNGWLIASSWNSPTWLRRLYVKYGVPTAPAKPGAISYLFSSFQPTSGSAIIQPVLSYGQNGGLGGNYWYLNSWYVWDHGSVIGPTVRVSPGDTIWGAMEGNGCAGNGTGCHWAIVTKDLSASGTPYSRIDITSASAFASVQGGALESYNATGCVMLPASHHGVFRALQVYGPTFNVVSPRFSLYHPDPECSMTESYTSTTADINWRS